MEACLIEQPTDDCRGDRLPVVYTRGDRRRDGRCDDRPVYTPYNWRRSRQNVAVAFLSPARATKSRRRLFVDFAFDASVDEVNENEVNLKVTPSHVFSTKNLKYL